MKDDDAVEEADIMNIEVETEDGTALDKGSSDETKE